MGHLINPISMRIGFFRYWEDVWYVEHIYYPEFLHLILKIRLFLIFFFGLHNIEKLGIFYSHFLIIKYYKSLSLNIYFYHGIYESLLDSFFDEGLVKFKQANFEERSRQPLWYNDVYNIFTLMNLLYVSLNEDLDYKRMLILVKRGDSLRLKLLMNNEYFINIPKHVRARFLFLLGIYIKIRKYLYKLARSRNVGLQVSVTKLLYLVLFNYTLGPIFFYIKNFLLLVFNFFVLANASPKMYIISNKNVTAKFLARFMARKLQQNYRVREISNPIRRELKKIAFCWGNRNSLKKNDAKYYEYYRGIFRRILVIMQNIYRSEFSSWYKISFMWLVFENFLLNLINRSFYLAKNRLVGISQAYMKHKSGFILFFVAKSKIFEKIYPIMLTQWNFSLLNPFLVLYGFCNIVADDLRTLNSLYFWFSHILVKDNVVCTLNYYLQRFLVDNNFIFNYKWLLSYNKLSKLKMRSTKPIDKPQRLLGFKFHFLGRFSRKQRAASIWFKEGYMPLNTLKCNIDYGFYSLPLKNSAINVKVWMYRTSRFVSWSYKVV